MKGIGILEGRRSAYIDHLVPLCQILEIPLLVTDPVIKELIEIYYPPMQIVLAEPDDYCLDPWLDPFDFFVYVDPARLAHGHFLFKEYFTHKKRRSIFSMHGNSDKKQTAFWIEQLADEDIVLLYGQQSADFLHAKGVKKPFIFCGNYRLEYYLENRSFFDQFSFPRKKHTLLYAPTWVSRNRKTDLRCDYSSFFDVYPALFKRIPEDTQLIVKMHPFFEILMLEETNEVKEAYPHVFFLDHFPPIYPLLSQVDAYLGDFSSIGYDFLYFQKPMFFLNLDRTSFLQKCGKSLSLKELADFYPVPEKNRHASSYERVQKEVYTYAYGDRKDLKTLRREIERACKSTY